MAKILKAPRGTQDVLPKDTYKWNFLEQKFLEISSRYGFIEIRFPTFEHTELFARGVGDTTDVVEKEMYTFNDKGDRSMTLKPEGTAGVVSAVIESGIINDALPLKTSYITPCFRYDKPQAGRLREFHQLGLESFGSSSALSDTEIITVANEFLQELGIKNVKLFINSIGCKSCRPAYNEMLTEYLNGHKENLCKTCLDRLDRNPLRVLDCKEEKCQQIVANAPKGVDHLCEECDTHFTALKQNLTTNNIEFEVNPLIVRGLDYYSKTVFEFVSNSLGAQSTVCGGGRYDGLVEILGGKPTPAIGLGMGIERLLLILEKEELFVGTEKRCQLMLVNIDSESQNFILNLSAKLRKNNLRVETNIMERSFKAQMKYANKINAEYMIVIGEEEVETGVFNLKNMETGETEKVTADNINKIIEGGN